jgi:anti-sigma B factor antagonist
MGRETRVTIERRDRVTIIHLAGDVTTFAEETIQQAYQEATAAGARVIAVDFKATDYINSAGIGILIGIVTQARRTGQRVLVAGLSPHFQKILGMVGLTQYVETYQTLEEALTRT